MLQVQEGTARNSKSTTTHHSLHSRHKFWLLKMAVQEFSSKKQVDWIERMTEKKNHTAEDKRSFSSQRNFCGFVKEERTISAPALCAAQTPSEDILGYEKGGQITQLCPKCMKRQGWKFCSYIVAHLPLRYISIAEHSIKKNSLFQHH